MTGDRPGSACVGCRSVLELFVAQVSLSVERVVLAAPLDLLGALAAGRLAGLRVDGVLTGPLRALLLLAALARLLALVLHTAHDGDSS
ncbi:hypothetical protein ACS04_34735 [Streptomyces roseus]|uniref:Uncharacterized protein n=1 Tax=Streptomyces roseus TaxID=66430 RepID=A0A0J6XGW9_9ACTN|nr:hypothetical protein ACS04_34735 [Streptomyces roseus]